MTRKNDDLFPQLNNPSRAAEAAYFKLLQNAVQGTYLASLLTDKVYDLFVTNMNNDLGTDLLSELEHVEILNSKYMEEIGALRSKVTNAYNKIETYVALNEDQKNVISGLREQIEAMQEDKRYSEESADNIIKEYQSRFIQFQNDLDYKDAEIIRLKAKLYDMMIDPQNNAF